MVDLYEDIEDGEDGDANVRVMPPSNVSLCTKLLRNERQVNAPTRVGRGEVGLNGSAPVGVCIEKSYPALHVSTITTPCKYRSGLNPH